MVRAAASACAASGLGLLVLPGLGQRPRDLGQGARLPVRVGDGAGDGLGLRGDGLGLLVLPGPGQRPRDLGQGARPPVRVGDRAGEASACVAMSGLLVLPGLRPALPRPRPGRSPAESGSVDRAGDGLGLLVLPGPGQRPRDLGQGARLPVGSVMERASGLGLVWCCPARASAPATSARASPARRVGDGAGDGLGLLVLPGPGQRPRDLARAPACGVGSVMVRAMVLGLRGDGSACSCCPAPASAAATSARASPASPGR